MSKTFSKVSAYPLDWPQGFPATSNPEASRFNTTLYKALENVRKELERFAEDSDRRVDDITISSNYSVGDHKPSKPGVAVWFSWDGEQHCIPVDRYNAVECNLQAIFHCIHAKRTILRHGGIELTKASMRGVLQLENKPISEFFDIAAAKSLDELDSVYRKMRSQHHPDRGGDSATFNALVTEYEAAKAKLKNGGVL